MEWGAANGGRVVRAGRRRGRNRPGELDITTKVAFFNYSNQVTGLKMLQGTRLPLRSTVQSG